jgi:hypothetical protein
LLSPVQVSSAISRSRGGTSTSSQVVVTRLRSGSMNWCTCRIALALAALTASRSSSCPSRKTGTVQSVSRSSYRTNARLPSRVARSVCSIMFTHAAVRWTSLNAELVWPGA